MVINDDTDFAPWVPETESCVYFNLMATEAANCAENHDPDQRYADLEMWRHFKRQPNVPIKPRELLARAHIPDWNPACEEEGVAPRPMEIENDALKFSCKLIGSEAVTHARGREKVRRSASCD